MFQNIWKTLSLDFINSCSAKEKKCKGFVWLDILHKYWWNVFPLSINGRHFKFGSYQNILVFDTAVLLIVSQLYNFLLVFVESFKHYAEISSILHSIYYIFNLLVKFLVFKNIFSSFILAFLCEKMTTEDFIWLLHCKLLLVFLAVV